MNNIVQNFWRIFLILTVLCIKPCYAGSIVPVITNAFKNGSPELDFRFRQEDSKQKGLKTGYATTLRTTVGFETAEFYASVFKVELVDVAHFFGLHYNPGVSDLYLPQYTLIADPPGAGITEVKLTVNRFEKNLFILGRQYINLDNQRFIGTNDFRQYPQSFDAISWNCTMVNNVDFFYAYIIDVNTNNANGRAAEGRHQLSTNIINVEWIGTKIGELGAYAYLNNDHTVNTNSNMTFGARILSPPDLSKTDNYAYLFEVAWQKSHFNNPVSYNAAYMHFYLSKTHDCFTALVGFERLGGNSAGAPNKMFITPLGSVDNFNGMAEAFTTTPTRGLDDAYITLSVIWRKMTAGTTYHLFRLDKGSGPKFAGQELDVYADFQLTKQIDFSIAYATYGAKNNAAISTNRFWVMLYAHLL